MHIPCVMLYPLSTFPRRAFAPYLLTILAFVCAVPLSAFAQAPDLVQVIHVPGDSPTIQGAIEMASDGDTVMVARGTKHD